MSCFVNATHPVPMLERLVLLVRKLGIWFANMQNREYENRVAKGKAKEMVHVKNFFVQ